MSVRSFFVNLVGCEPKISFMEWLKGQTVRRWRLFSGTEMVLFILGLVLFFGGSLRVAELIFFCPAVSQVGFFLQLFWITSGALLIAHSYESSSKVAARERLKAEEKKYAEAEARAQQLREIQDVKFRQVKTAIGIEENVIKGGDAS